MATNDVDLALDELNLDDLDFSEMSEAELRHWVEANPRRVNDRIPGASTPLIAAVFILESPPLILWLVKEKGADVNAVDKGGATVLYVAKSLEVLDALLECGADPTCLPSSRSSSKLVPT